MPDVNPGVGSGLVEANADDASVNGRLKANAQAEGEGFTGIHCTGRRAAKQVIGRHTFTACPENSTEINSATSSTMKKMMNRSVSKRSFTTTSISTTVLQP